MRLQPLLLSLIIPGVAYPVAATAQTVAAPNPAPLAGTYQGVIKPTPLVSLTLVFKIAGTNAVPTATLDVPEQSLKAFPVQKTTVTGDTVTLSLTNIGASFSGKRSVDGRTITGTFRQNGLDIPLTLTRTEKVVALSRPQTPKPPFPYRTVEVSYPNRGASGVTLAGTLTVPKGVGRFPVALFITGSGAQDRDETIFGHKLFAVIADALARRGVASLRVDDRGIGKSVGDFAGATTDDFAGDVRAGVTFLRERTEVDPSRIGLIGHSEGGIIAPMVAAGDPDIAFIVLLAGTGVPGDAVITAQQKAIVSKISGGSEAAIAQNQRVSRPGIAAIKSAKNAADAREKVKVIIQHEADAAPEAQRVILTRQLETAFLPWCTPWFIRFLSLDPAVALKQTKCPVLALNGANDLQVIASQNLPAIRAALEKGGNTSVTVRELLGLNHLFQTAPTGLPTEYGTITETIAPEALKIIGDWIVTQSKPAP